MFREELRFSTLASVTFAIVEDHNTTGRHVLAVFKREFHGVVSASDIYPLPAVGFMFTVDPHYWLLVTRMALLQSVTRALLALPLPDKDRFRPIRRLVVAFSCILYCGFSPAKVTLLFTKLAVTPYSVAVDILEESILTLCGRSDYRLLLRDPSFLVNSPLGRELASHSDSAFSDPTQFLPLPTRNTLFECGPLSFLYYFDPDC